MSDPIAELVRDLRDHGKPSLRWAVEFAPDGDMDAAIARAWADSHDDWMMLRLLYRADGKARLDASDELKRHRADCPYRHGSPCCAAAIRRAVPTPPTLAELLRRVVA